MNMLELAYFQLHLLYNRNMLPPAMITICNGYENGAKNSTNLDGNSSELC